MTTNLYTPAERRKIQEHNRRVLAEALRNPPGGVKRLRTGGIYEGDPRNPTAVCGIYGMTRLLLMRAGYFTSMDGGFTENGLAACYCWGGYPGVRSLLGLSCRDFVSLYRISDHGSESWSKLADLLEAAAYAKE